MNVTFRAADIQSLISQPQKFSHSGETNLKSVDKTSLSETKPKKSKVTAAGFSLGAAAAIALTVLIAGKGSIGKGFKAISGKFTKLADEAVEKFQVQTGEIEKLKFKTDALKNKLVSVFKENSPVFTKKIPKNTVKEAAGQVISKATSEISDGGIDHIMWKTLMENFPRT